jgi:hypothetical protein
MVSMQTDSIPSLGSLEYLAYLDDSGAIHSELQGKIAVYAIFDRDRQLQFVGYSRDVYLSLKQHLIRRSQLCYWLKLQTISRPSRTILEEIRQAWIAENDCVPSGNSTDEAKWTQPIDAKQEMTIEEREILARADELSKIKLLKQVARRVEAMVEAQIKDRGVTMDLRFNPKLKEEGLLDLK